LFALYNLDTLSGGAPRHATFVNARLTAPSRGFVFEIKAKFAKWNQLKSFLCDADVLKRTE
ncbi:UNVERIFIED_CONTAM: hypothetical protein K2H54_045963, partial [Gekko kuhli]